MGAGEGVCPVLLPIHPLIPQPAQDCLERLVLRLPTLHFEPLTFAALEGYSVEGWATDDYDACERRADGRQALGFLQLSRGEPIFVRSEARPGEPGNRFAAYYHGISYRGSGWFPVDRFTQLPP